MSIPPCSRVEQFQRSPLTPMEIQTLRALTPPDLLRKTILFVSNPAPSRMARWLPESICALFGLAPLQIPQMCLPSAKLQTFRGTLHPETIAVVGETESVVHRPRAGTIWQIGNFPVVVRPRRYHLRQLFRSTVLFLRPTEISIEKSSPVFAVPCFAPPGSTQRYWLAKTIRNKNQQAA